MLKKIAIGLGALVLLLIGGAAIAFYTVDPNVLKPYAERAISNAIGRPFTINGDLELERGWTIKVRAHDVHVANAEWSDRPEMASVKTVEASLNVWDLVTKGQITIPEVILDTPVASLERNEQGEANWQFGTSSADDSAAAPQERADLPFIGKLEVRNAQLDYRDAQSGRDISSKLTTLTAVSQSEGSRMKVDAEGEVQGMPLDLDGTFGSYQLLADSEEPFPVEGNLSIGNSRIALNGTIADPATMEGLDFKTDLAAQDLSKAMGLLGVPVPEIPPFNLAGQLTYKGGDVRLENLKGSVGDSSLAGWAAFASSGDRPKVSAELTSERFDLDDMAGLIGRAPAAGPGETASPEQEKEAEIQENDPHVIPDPAFHADAWTNMDADVRFRGKRVQAKGIPLDDVDFHVVMDDGRLRIDPLNAAIAGATVTGRLAADGQRKPPAVELDLAGSGMDLERFLGEFDMQEYGRGRMSARISMKGEGDSLRDVLDTSNGQMAVIMEEGEITALLIEALGLDPAELLPVLFGGNEPGSGQRLFDVRCLVADFQVAKGIAYGRNFVLDTSDSVITAAGAFNLSTEAIELDFEPHPKDTSILAAPAPLYVRGTFGSPSFMPDPTPALLRGAAAVAVGVVLTPLAAFLPFIDIGTAEDAPCGSLISETQKQNKLKPAEP